MTLFKILRGLDRVDVDMVPLMDMSQIQGHSHKIRVQSFKTKMGRNSFTQKVVNHWNYLPMGVAEARSLETFKID